MKRFYIFLFLILNHLNTNLYAQKIDMECSDMIESISQDMDKHCIECIFGENLPNIELISFNQNSKVIKNQFFDSTIINFNISTQDQNIDRTSFINKWKIDNLYKLYCSFLI